MEKVLVGLSGGVDSAAVAKLLLQQGYEVYGVYLGFCQDSDPSRAKAVAEKLEIPFFAVNRKRSFRNRVIRPFVETYLSGQTPNPCVECNRNMKFAALLKEADRLGIEKVATGHYARVLQDETGRWQLLRGKDGNKDQSYFLWKLTQKQLSRILFPLAETEKEEVKALAKDFVEQQQKESMEICFIPKGNTAAFLEQNGGGRLPCGEFVDASGRILGQHQGIYRYTVGQRRGLGVALGERRFVTRILPDKNQIELGDAEELMVSEVLVEEVRFVSCTKEKLPKTGVYFQGRNRGRGQECTISFEGKALRVFLKQPSRRFSPGQSACLYEGDRLLAGGVISMNTL